jgi:O-antigen chain-terminating methyltransferase
MMKKTLARTLSRIARALGVSELQSRVDNLERRTRERFVSDDLYAAIEDRFRGDPSMIRERQKAYLSHLSDIPAGLRVLDLGSGRGEWLSLLRDEGIPAEGVDTNASFVSHGRDAGLAVTCRGLVDHLRDCVPGSVGAVTMFQVAEHLPLGVLEETLTLAHRSLAVGGVLIVEIPNVETLRVGAANFWIDPTHERPLFPEFLVFLVERAGFRAVQRVTSTSLVAPPDGLTAVEQELFSQINGHADFAVIARK